MATNYTREWIGFFTGCGIPEDIATMYALIFYENRIQKNMLLDLNKEYLKDMGITVMGDVIAILRHSKIIHDKYVREQILADEESLQRTESKSMSDSSPVNINSTPMKRMLKHYTRKFNSEEFDPGSGTEPVIVSNEKILPGRANEKMGLQRQLKRKISTTTQEKNIRLNKELHPTKTRRILLAQEGVYKIKVPSGTTEKSKKLLEQAKKKKVKTVFERLGESSVSSTTSEISSTSAASNPPNKEKNPSVFARLGEKTSIVSSTSCVGDSDISPSQNQLPYAGILKAGGQVKCLGKTTMRADEQMQSEGSRNKNGISIKKRLGLTQPSEQLESRSKTLVKTMRQSGQEGANSFLKGAKKNTRITLGNFTKAETAPTQLTSSTAQSQSVNVRNLKRRAPETSETSPEKKVRFGNISHRLIPGNPERSETTFVKNYSKLTMTISNTNANKNTQSLRVKGDSLSSHNTNDKIGVKARVGNMPVKGRLGNRLGVQGQKPQIKKISTVKDRLG